MWHSIAFPVTKLTKIQRPLFILTCSVLLRDSWHHSCEPSELCHAVLCSKCSKDNLARVAALWFGEFKDNIDRNHGTSRNQGANRTHQVLKQSVAQSNATSNVFRHAPFGWFVLGSILLKHSQVWIILNPLDRRSKFTTSTVVSHMAVAEVSKIRKPIGEVGCCESRMAEQIHWWTERWLELCFLEWLQWLQWPPHHNSWM